LNKCCGVLKILNKRIGGAVLRNGSTVMSGSVTRNGHGVSCSGKLVISSSGNAPKQRKNNQQEKEGQGRKKQIRAKETQITNV
jgi:hypothetical protein